MKSSVKPDNRPLVIGYGNPLRGDDALGHVIVAQLKTQLDAALVTLMDCQQLTLDLAEDIAQASSVILIDAAVNGMPGTRFIKVVKPSRSVSHTLEHHVTPATLVTATDVLYGNLPPVILLSVVGQQWEAGADLSEPVKASVPHVITTIINLLSAS